MPVSEEQGAGAGRHSPKGVTCRVMLKIGLGFNDAPGHQLALYFVHQNFAEQSSSQRNRVRGHAAAPDTLDGFLKFARSLADDGSLLRFHNIKTDNQDS